jgi:hypothetical protein
MNETLEQFALRKAEEALQASKDYRTAAINAPTVEEKKEYFGLAYDSIKEAQRWDEVA